MNPLNEPGKVDDQTEKGRRTVDYPIDSMILPDPIRRVIRAVNKDNQNIPGEIVVSPQGQLLKKYLEYQRFEGDIVESYNNWIVHQLQKQVAARPLRLPDGYFMAVLKIDFVKPKLSTSANENVNLYPKTARDSGYSYVANMYGNLGLFKTVGNKAQLVEQATNVFLGKIPVMLGSVLCHLSGKTEQQRLEMRECPKDPLGYFIIKGTERIIMIQEKLRVNRIFMFGDKKGQPICRMTCSTTKGTRVVTLSQSETRGIQISLHFVGKGHSLSVFQIYRILGITDTDTMLNMILMFVNEKHRKKIWWILQPSFLELMSVAGNDDLEDIRNKRGSRVLTQSLLLQYLTDDLFPQMSRLPTINRIHMLSMMVARYAEFMAGISSLDDRDSWANKRLETAGRSMEQLFNGLWNKMIEGAETAFEKQKIKDVKLSYVIKLLTTTIISDEFVSAFSANNWGVKGSSFSKENITDVLKRDAPLSVYSHLTRINTPTSRQARQPHIRMVQMSQIGYIDAIETPEGENCVPLNTPVLLEDGVTTEELGKIAGNRVMSVNGESLKHDETGICKLFQYDAKERNHKVYKITTISGREITATFNHPFLTQRGYVEVQDLNTEVDGLCIWNVQDSVSSDAKHEIVLDAVEFERNVLKAGVSASRANKYVRDLSNLNLLPLYADDKRLPILARICGLIWTDGCLAVYDEAPCCSGIFGTQEDAEQFEADVERLGFDKCKIKERNTRVTTKETGRVAKHHTFIVQHSSAFTALIISLGVICGKKVDVSTPPVPGWILNGSKLVKREWLAGFQGGDGSAIFWNLQKGHNQYTFALPPTSQHKNDPHVESLYAFMAQMKQLFEEFDIVVRHIKRKKTKSEKCRAESKDKVAEPDGKNEIVETNEKDYMSEDVLSDDMLEELADKDGKNRIELTFSKSEEDMIKYLKTIGYRYAKTKTIKGNYAIEYLSYKQQLKAPRLKLLREVKARVNAGETVSDIAFKLSITYKEAYNLSIAKTEKIKCCNAMDFDDFLKRCNDGHVYIPIKEITEVDPIVVGDFTTFSDNHSFIANSFVVGNCGLVKHKAVGCYISIDRDDALLIEKVLQSGKLLSGPSEDSTTVLIINGKFMGWCPGAEMHDYLKSLKLSSQLGKDTCIVLNTSTDILNVYTDGARPTRPLLVVDQDGELVIRKREWQTGRKDENGKQVLEKWEEGKKVPEMDELLAGGAIEYLDAWEQAESEQSVVLISQSIADLNARKREIAEAKNRLDGLNIQIAKMRGKTLNAIYTAEDREFLRKQYSQVDPDAPKPMGMDEGGREDEGEIGEMESEEIRELYESTLRALEEDKGLTEATIQNLTVRGKSYTHSELDPNGILGIAASIIPLPDHNQSPRNVYQCLSLESIILCPNGDRKEIGQMKDGDEVLTVNPETLKVETTKIKNYFKISASEHCKKIYEITTASGRKVRVTGDHPLLTQQGFVRTDNLKVNEDQLVIYNPQK